jgi:hypothetical protein
VAAAAAAVAVVGSDSSWARWDAIVQGWWAKEIPEPAVVGVVRDNLGVSKQHIPSSAAVQGAGLVFPFDEQG